jgi:hypothetical protein
VRRRKESPHPFSFSRPFISTPVAIRKNMMKEWAITSRNVATRPMRKWGRTSRGAPGTR